MFKTKFKKVVNKKQSYLLILLFIFSVFVSFIETVGLSSTAIFVMILTDANNVISKVPFEVIRNYLESQSYFSLITISAISLTFFFLIKNLVVIFYNLFELHIRKILISFNREKFYKSYLNIDYAYHLKNNSSQYINNIMNITSQSVTYIIFYIRAFKDILLLLFLIITLLFVSIKISFSLILLMSAISGFVYFLIKAKIQFIGKESIKLDSYLLKNLSHGIGSFKTTKISGIENFFLKDFSDKNNQRLKYDLSNRFLQTLPRLFLEVLGILFLTLTILFLIVDGNSIKDILPTITLIAVITVKIVPTFINLNTVFNNLKYFGESFNKMSDEYDKLYEHSKKEDEKVYSQDSKTIKPIKSLEVKNVSFSYSPDNLILNNLSVKIISGELVGISGKSGSGKTTFVDIILGLLNPENGQVLINDDDIKNKINLYKKKISYVPQEVFLIDDSIKKNIAFGNNDRSIDEEKIFKVLDYVKLSDYINQLPNKIDTVVGERGARLSGGQKQRIGIARALYNDADLIVFDESTNALDLETEEKIIEDIYKLKNNRIIIFITHRTGSLKKCDKILSLDEGKLTTFNSFEKYKNY